MYGGNFRGRCFRCDRVGHFQRECPYPRAGATTGSTGTTSASAFGGSAATAAALRPDPRATTTWACPPPDLEVQRRNDREFRTFLRMMWDHRLERLLAMLFQRFGGGVDLSPHFGGPSDFLERLEITGDLPHLVELDFQRGRRAEAHFTMPGGRKRKEFIIDPTDESVAATLRNHRVLEEDLALFAGQADVHGFRKGWWHENGSRLGIPGTLHRLSGISGRLGELIGVIVRFGRTITGTVEKMLPPELRNTHECVLLLGPPNSGKTTVLREFARQISDLEDRVVVVVDKTSEIAGASNEPHPAIGVSCRWLPVDDPRNQHNFMRMAVENMSPDTILVDEISTETECDAARTIAQRGVQLVATCHGKSLTELVNDNHRSVLLGGCTSVTLSGSEVQNRLAAGGDGRKQVMVRKYEPIFSIVIELHSRELWYVHKSSKDSADAYLRREPVIAYRATPGKFEQVVAHPTEDGFRYEPELPRRQDSTQSTRPARTMVSKGADVQVPVAAARPPPTPARAPVAVLPADGAAADAQGPLDGGAWQASYAALPTAESPWLPSS